MKTSKAEATQVKREGRGEARGKQRGTEYPEAMQASHFNHHLFFQSILNFNEIRT